MAVISTTSLFDPSVLSASSWCSKKAALSRSRSPGDPEIVECDAALPVLADALRVRQGGAQRGDLRDLVRRADVGRHRIDQVAERPFTCTNTSHQITRDNCNCGQIVGTAWARVVAAAPL